MKLKTITGRNLKGQSFTHELRAINLIVGDNAVGKTARMDAIRLALMGYLPELGKTNDATYQLASGPKMVVEGETDAGSCFGRSWEAKGKSITAGEAGQIPATPPVLLDPTIYLSKSENERVKYIFGLMDLTGSEFTGEKIIQDVSGLKSGLADKTVETELNKLLAELDDSDTHRHEDNVSVQDWLEATIVERKSLLSEANDAKKRMEKFAQGMVELKSADTEEAAVNVGPEIEELRKKLAIIQTKTGEMNANRKNAEPWKARVAELQAKLKEKDPATLRAQWEKVKAKLAELTEKFSPTPIDLSAGEEVQRLEINLAGAKARLQTASRGITEATKEKTETLANERCPCCNSKSKTWRESFEEKIETRLKGLSREVENANAVVTGLQSEIKSAQERLHEAVTAENQRQELGRELSHYLLVEGDAKAAVLTAESLRPELDQLLANPMECTEGAIQALCYEQDEITRKIEELTSRQNRAIAGMNERKRVAEAKEQLVKATARAMALKLVVAKLQEVQANMVAAAFEGVLKVANQVLGDAEMKLLKTPLAYRQGELGRFETGLWISHKTFSGQEKKCVMVALGVALAQSAPIRIVLLDELGVFTPAKRFEFLGHMERLIELKLIDQVVAIDSTDVYGNWELSDLRQKITI